ncbi:AI-2E family transporter [soil metagenome]
MNNRNYPFIFRATAGLLFVILLILTLYFAADVLKILAFAVLFSYLLFPLTSWLEGKKVPRGVANVLAIILFLGVFVTAGFVLFKQGARMMADFPELKEHALNNMAQVETYLEDKLPFAPQNRDNWLGESLSGFLSSGEETLRTTFAATATTIGSFFLMPFFIFFMLHFREKLRDFVVSVVPPEKHDLTDEVLLKISKVTSRYMMGIVIVTVILCALTSLGLVIIGLKYAILLGIIAGLFNLIPYFGTYIGGTVPLIMALLTMNSPKYVLFVLLLIFILQFLENNVLTPNITGSQVRLNPLFTLISILFGAMIWGIAGMFMAIPFVGMFKIVCENVDQLQPVARLIGIEERKGWGGKVQTATGRWVARLRRKKK